MTRDIPVLALTPGEPAGIGPECTVRLAFEHPELRLLAVADPRLLGDAAASLGLDIGIDTWRPGDKVRSGRISCYPLTLAKPALPV